MACFCEYGYEALGFVKSRIDQISDYKFSTKTIFHYFYYSLQKGKLGKIAYTKVSNEREKQADCSQKELAWRGWGLG